MATKKSPKLDIEPTPAIPAPDEQPVDVVTGQALEAEDTRKRRLYLLLLLVLLLICGCLAFFIVRYIQKPQPVTQMIPVVNQVINFPPVPKSAFLQVKKPVAVAVSTDNQRIYVVDSGGDGSIKMYNRNGDLIKSFALPGTSAGQRDPRYMAVAPDGRLFVTDRAAIGILIFSADGEFQDAIVAPDMTLGKALSQKMGLTAAPAAGSIRSYNPDNRKLAYQLVDHGTGTVDVPLPNDYWAPLGLRFNLKGDLIYTDLSKGMHTVHVIPATSLADLTHLQAPTLVFGKEGSAEGEMEFPQTAVQDNRGNFYVADGNNNRLLKFGPDGKYLTFFGYGDTDAGVNLPRGMAINSKDQLYVADAVRSVVHVYDVAQDQPQFLYNIGTLGAEAGQLRTPIDVCVDGTGRVYIADRDNDRIDIWSY